MRFHRKNGLDTGGGHFLGFFLKKSTFNRKKYRYFAAFFENISL
jgi:hypothetical protein